jgi:hypothetical protein
MTAIDPTHPAAERGAKAVLAVSASTAAKAQQMKTTIQTCDKLPSHDTSRRERPNSWLG